MEPRTPPKVRSLPWVSLPLLAIAEVGLQSQPTSIACQRYHTPNSPHLRHGRPPRCSLVDFHRPNWSNQRQKEGREAFCPFYMGYRRTFGYANAPPKSFYPKVLEGGQGVLLSRSTPSYSRTPPLNNHLCLHFPMALAMISAVYPIRMRAAATLRRVAGSLGTPPYLRCK